MLTDEQKQIIEGCLLGDGCICINKNGKNPYFSYCGKNKDHVEFVFKYLKNLCNYSEIKKISYFDKRTSKTYTSFRFITKCLEDLSILYNKWYKGSLKNVIPNDLILDNVKCLFWYIGDGGLIRSGAKYRKQYGEMIKFATHCFDVNSLNKLIIPQLKQFEPKLYLCKNNPIIIIPRRKVKAFLEYIGPCPVPSYEYKWNISQYINKKFENKIDTIDLKTISTFCKLYKNGMSYFKIAKKYKLEAARVKYYLIKNKVYVTGRDKLKKKLNDEEIIQIKNLRNEKIPWQILEEKFKLSRFVLAYYIKSIDNK